MALQRSKHALKNQKITKTYSRPKKSEKIKLSLKKNTLIFLNDHFFFSTQILDIKQQQH